MLTKYDPRKRNLTQAKDVVRYLKKSGIHLSIIVQKESRMCMEYLIGKACPEAKKGKRIIATVEGAMNFMTT